MPLASNPQQINIEHGKIVDPLIGTTADTVKAPSLFQPSLLSAKDPKPVIHFTHYDFIVAGILFFSFCLYVWLFTTNRKRLNQVIKAFYINRYANQLAREEVSMGNRVSVFLSVLFVLTMTIFVLQVNDYYGFIPVEAHPMSYIIIAASLFLIYFFKLLIVRFLGSVFQTQKEAGDYSMTVFLFGNTLGLFMMPVVICLSFAKQVSPQVFIYSGIGIITTFLCARIVRGLIIGFNSVRVSAFYLFLYLCTLEILPFAIMIKLFMIKVQ